MKKCSCHKSKRRSKRKSKNTRHDGVLTRAMAAQGVKTRSQIKGVQLSSLKPKPKSKIRSASAKKSPNKLSSELKKLSQSLQKIQEKLSDSDRTVTNVSPSPKKKSPVKSKSRSISKNKSLSSMGRVLVNQYNVKKRNPTARIRKQKKMKNYECYASYKNNLQINKQKYKSIKKARKVSGGQVSRKHSSCKPLFSGKYGSRRQVFNGTKEKTTGNNTAGNLKKNFTTQRIVTQKQSNHGMSVYVKNLMDEKIGRKLLYQQFLMLNISERDAVQLSKNVQADLKDLGASNYTLEKERFIKYLNLLAINEKIAESYKINLLRQHFASLGYQRKDAIELATGAYKEIAELGPDHTIQDENRIIKRFTQ